MKAALRNAAGCRRVDRPSLWRDWIQANKIRRKVVHQGAKASGKEATKVVDTIEAFVAYADENRTK